MKKYSKFTSEEIKPEGWLYRQLRIQADGLCGNLDKIWPDVRDSAWVGGNREGWERVPYWLDGFVPLAYILNDSDMISRAEKYINNILDGQKSDGWICPCDDSERGGYDIWAAFLILKVLTVYADCSKNERVLPVIKSAIACLDVHMDKYPLFNWGKYRWYECLIPVIWLYEHTGDEKLKNFARKLKAQGFDYSDYYRTDSSWKKPEAKWTFETHIVNTAMAFKADALYSDFIGERNSITSDENYRMLYRYHGTSAGHITGDECLAGKSPVHGAELCSIGEAMYSFEELFISTGKPVWADRLESLTFNSFPATCSDDMWTHQYDQQINQTACTDTGNIAPWFTNGSHSSLFGLEPNYGCCTANMGQAFPKFALSAFVRSKDGIVCVSPVPCTLNTTVNGVKTTVKVITRYPFGDSVKFNVNVEKPVNFTFGIRIPGSVKAKIGGRIYRSGIHSITRLFRGETEICVEFICTPEIKKAPDGLYCLKRGALLYSLPIKYSANMREYEQNGVARKFPYCDYEYFPASDWNYGFCKGDIVYEEHEIGEFPFSAVKPPVTIKCEMARVRWNTLSGYPFICAEKPVSSARCSEIVTMTLQPYGTTVLRMTDMPKADDIHK